MSGNLYLTGFMGSGKSAVGRILAKRLKRPFVDLDALIVRRAGLSILDIFEKRGERAFRALEKKLLVQVSRREKTVIALGGGALLDAGSRRRVKATGAVILLSCSKQELLKRLKRQTVERPLLAGFPLTQRVAALLKSRRPHYLRTADVRITTTALSPRTAAVRAARILAVRGYL